MIVKCKNCAGTGRISGNRGVFPNHSLHEFEPHKQWPWFCRKCGYPEHEGLKHYAAQAIEARSDKTEGLGLKGESAAPTGWAQKGESNAQA